MTSNVAPLDVVELILDELKLLDRPHWSSPVDPLQSCALVCHDWLTLARQRLFRHQTFLDEGHPDQFGGFLSALESSPDIAGYVREITIYEDSTWWIWELAEVCTKFRCVQSIEIELYEGAGHWNDEKFQAFEACLGSIGKSAMKLSFSSITFQDEGQLGWFVALMPQLVEIKLSSCMVAKGRRVYDDAPLVCHDLRKVHFHHCERSLYKSLLQPTYVPSLRELFLFDRRNNYQDSLELPGTIQSLESFSLEYIESPDHDGMSQCCPVIMHLQLNACLPVLSRLPSKFPNLKHFIIKDPPTITHFRNVAAIIPHLPPTIMKITIMVRSVMMSHELDFENIDSAIDSRRFPALTSVEFVFSRSMTLNLDRHQRLKRLELYKKGLLITTFQ